MKRNRFLPVLPIFLLFAAWGYAEIIFDFEEGIDKWESLPGKGVISHSKEYACSGSGSMKVSVANVKTAWIQYPHKLSLDPFAFMKFSIFMDDATLPEASFKCYIKDSEWNWFETELFKIKGGEKKEAVIDISHTSFDWKPVAHVKSWDTYVTREICELGIIVFFGENYTGNFHVDSFELAKGEPPEEKICLYNFEAGKNPVKRFEKFEISFNASYVPANPFDREEFKVTGTFFAPSGNVAEIPAFYYHDYLRYLDSDGENLAPYGTEGWKLRFTPMETGLHRYLMSIYRNNEKTGELEGGTFIVEESGKRGFVKWDINDPFYMSFQNGDFFYPIGHTLRSPDDIRSPYRYEFNSPENMGTFAYDSYFKKMAKNGENYARIWMAAWWAGIEWNPFYAPHYKGLGKYSLENAWRLDRVLDEAERHGIYVDLTLINHGQFGRPDAEWLDNPYNVLNGGMLEGAEEFFTNRLASDYFKKRLDYIVSRWGHSTSIVFWELWNEVDLTINYNTQNVKKWHKYIHPYLREIDPYNHLITTHYCRKNADPGVWVIPEIEMIVGNSYSYEMVDSVLEFFTKRKPFEKPVLINEYGRGKNRQNLENNLHCGIWSSSVMPMTGAALFWWWPFIDHFDLYFHYKALSEFWKGEDRRGKNFQLTDAKVEPGKNGMGVTGMQNNSEGFFWVYAEKVFNSNKPLASLPKSRKYRVVMNNFEPGDYTAEFWDTNEGKVIERKEIRFTEAKQEFTTPEFLNDIAVKIKRK